MKALHPTRWLSLVLTVAMLLSVCTLIILPASADGYDTSVQNGTGSRTALRASDSISYRARVLGAFTAFSFTMPTWTTTDSVCRLSLYAWNETFDQTVAGEPIATKLFDPMKDNATNSVSFEEQPAGEYLFHISDCRGLVGVWINENVQNPLGYAYKDGAETQTIEPELKIRMVEKLDTPFGLCDPSIAPVDGKHTPPAEYVLPQDSLMYTHEVMPDTWVFTDGLGRTSLTNAEVGNPRDDRTLAMFYWTWHVSQGAALKPFNNQEFLNQHPEALNDYNHPGWPTGGVQHFWNQPIYGYYKTDDAWVLRKQAEMLANAGVDAIFTDNTNGTFTWRNSYQPLFKAWSDAMDDGVQTPKVSFMLPFAPGADSISQLKDLYTDFYRDGDYHKLWFYWEGKPMLMAHEAGLDKNSNLEKEIMNFFTYRNNYAGYINENPALNSWGWLSTYPQAIYYGTRDNRKAKQVEQITVGVAVNHNYVLHQIAAMNGENIIGRSYTSTGYHTEEGAKLWGYNFSEQFDYALQKDPKVVFVTGWNEWIAGRYKSWPEGLNSAVENAFPDQCNDEYSRDIEPSKGDLKDHYYYLLVNYVRRYKGVRPIPTPTSAMTIDMQGPATQWDNVGPYYASYIGNTDHRDADGYASCHYVEYSGRNDIIGSRIARDDENIYFYVECNEDITPYTDPLWMVLYIDSDTSHQGWETFDYVINKTSPTATTAILERFTGNGYESEKVAEVSYKVQGKTMQICVPKTALGLSGYDFTINFSWTDNVHDEADQAAQGDLDYVYTTFSGDIMDFYISGDVAPGGRFKFSYISTTENAGKQEPETPSSAESDTVQEPLTEAPTTTPEVTMPEGTDTESATEGTAESGCSSSVNSTLLLTLTVILLCGAFAFRKRQA